MKNIVLMLVLWLTTSAWAQFEWPNQQIPVRIDGQLVRVFWLDGKPYVEREAVLSLFHIRTGPDQLDLAETLQSRGYVVTQQPDGSIWCAVRVALQPLSTSAIGRISKGSRPAPPGWWPAATATWLTRSLSAPIV